ncbi:MAG TPA: ATP phosphoribosyltransferase [Clostridiaceae bacterium]|nr:ATP phosphoribosyltransferase [Clostridiaceae bacterium]
MRYLTIALAKGRLEKEAIEMFDVIGISCSEAFSQSRKLIITDEKNKVKFILAKPADVPTYVEYGAADIGIVGKDTLMEEGRNLYEVLNLGFARCKMVVAGSPSLIGKLDSLNNKRVATKYPRIAREYFENKKRESIEVIKLNGSVELAPLTGLSEVIVDLVESGRTLKENGLVVLETIAEISARLVVNRVSMKMQNERINKIVDGIREYLRQKEAKEQEG